MSSSASPPAPSRRPLWIATPNLEALGHRRFGADWLGLDPPRHLVLFTHDSLDGLIRQIGLEPLGATCAAAGVASVRRRARPSSRVACRRRVPIADYAGCGDRDARELSPQRESAHADEMVALARKPRTEHGPYTSIPRRSSRPRTSAHGTRVWAFAHVMAGARIGADCNVCDHTYIEGGVVVGDRVTIKSGVFLWEGMVVEDDVFLGPQATFTNDRFPRSRRPWTCEGIRISRGASVGAGAVVLPGVTIGERAMVGAGAVVTKDVEADTVVVGNPARVVRRLVGAP